MQEAEHALTSLTDEAVQKVLERLNDVSNAALDNAVLVETNRANVAALEEMRKIDDHQISKLWAIIGKGAILTSIIYGLISQCQYPHYYL